MMCGKDLKIPPLLSKADGLPDQLIAIVIRATRELFGDGAVAGVVLSGSIAAGTADKYSDADLLIIAEDVKLLPLWQGRFDFEQRLGQVMFRVDLSDVCETSCAIYYTGALKLHTTYRALSHLDENPEYRHAVALFSRTRRIEDWLAACREVSMDPNAVDLRLDDLRFWFWLLQGASKLARGELWAAFDTLHTLREILISFLDRTRGVDSEGFRRLEARWDCHWLRVLEKTVRGSSREELAAAYRALITGFRDARNEAAGRMSMSWEIGRLELDHIVEQAEAWLDRQNG